MIIKLTDKNGKLIVVNSDYIVSTDPNNTNGTRVIMDSEKYPTIIVKETPEEIFEILNPCLTNAFEKKVEENLDKVMEAIGAEENISVPVPELLPENVTKDSMGRYRENGVLIGKERKAALGLTA